MPSEAATQNPTNPTQPELLVPAVDIARIVGVSRACVSQAIRRGVLRPVAVVPYQGGQRRRMRPLFSLRQAEEWARRRAELGDRLRAHERGGRPPERAVGGEAA